MMGPIRDTRGLEQGGISSSDQYKIYNNEQADVAHSSLLGVPFLNLTISCISLADDTVLLSNHLYNLENLLFLTKRYCSKYDVVLVPEKTKLISFHKKDCDEAIYERATSNISLHSCELPFASKAEHLGIIRTEDLSDMEYVLDRLSAHRKQLFSVLPAGLALHHSGNPAAAIRVEKMYCLPVLLSGLASVPLLKSEIRIISNYYKKVLARLMRIYDRTPDPALYFLAGSLPAEGYLHLHQLSIFGMVCRLENNVLKDLATAILKSALPSMKSVFQNIYDSFVSCIIFLMPSLCSKGPHLKIHSRVFVNSKYMNTGMRSFPQMHLPYLHYDFWIHDIFLFLRLTLFGQA